MKLPNGDVIVPPSCTAITEFIAGSNRSYAPKDLRPEHMLYDVIGDPESTDIILEFRNRPVYEAEPEVLLEQDVFGDDEISLAINTVTVPTDSPVSDDALRLRFENAGETPEQKNARTRKVEQVRQSLCDRIAECHGIIEGGECWALGPTAISQVIQSVMGE